MFFLMCWVFGVKLFYAVLAALQPSLVKNIRNTPIELIVNQLICLLPPVLLFILRHKDQVQTHLAFRPMSFRNSAYILGMTVCLLPIMMFLSGLSSLLFPNPAQAVLMEMKDSSLELQLLSVAMIPAFLEEFNFRGVILGYATNEPLHPDDLKKAVLVNGLFFAFMHLNLQQFPYAFVIGTIFALFVYWTGSLTSSILAHFMLNAFSVRLAAYIVTHTPDDTSALDAFEWQSLIPLAWLALLFGFGFIWIYRHFKAYNLSNKKRELAALETVTPLYFVTREFWAVVILYVLICLFFYWP
jgi:membrane protease YdiL (CAAX protease family)